MLLLKSTRIHQGRSIAPTFTFPLPLYLSYINSNLQLRDILSYVSIELRAPSDVKKHLRHTQATVRILQPFYEN